MKDNSCIVGTVPPTNSSSVPMMPNLQHKPISTIGFIDNKKLSQNIILTKFYPLTSCIPVILTNVAALDCLYFNTFHGAYNNEQGPIFLQTLINKFVLQLIVLKCLG